MPATLHQAKAAAQVQTWDVLEEAQGGPCLRFPQPTFKPALKSRIDTLRVSGSGRVGLMSREPRFN